MHQYCIITHRLCVPVARHMSGNNTAVLHCLSGSSFLLSALAVYMTAQSQRPPLQQLLSEAVTAPSCIYTEDGGAVLALSIHCETACVRECPGRSCHFKTSRKCCAGLFVQAGFTNLQTLRLNDYIPQPNWNCSREAWTFQYRKYAGACHTLFVCICSAAKLQF